jgi:glycosyltransferase involved in cell wall biosynthesis
VTEGIDTLRDRRVVVLTSRLWNSYNDLWDAAEPAVGALAVVGARPSRHDTRADLSDTRTALRSLDFGRGLVWEHLVGLRRFVRDFRADLVHINRELWAVASQELISCDAAIIVHGAENLWHHGGRAERLARDRLVERAVRRIDGYASWNHDGAEHVAVLRAELGLAPIASLVTPAIVPGVLYRGARWSPVQDGPLRVLLVGRATPEKGFQDVIEAAASLPDVQVTLCGAGDMLEELTARARACGVKFRALGFVDAAEVVREMARSHVLVQPSLTTATWAEQFGRAVAEAMTVGLPCLVSDSGELPHLVDHDPQAIFAEGDVDDLCRCLRSMTDPAALRALAARQHSLAATWSPERAGAAVADLWRDVLS